MLSFTPSKTPPPPKKNGIMFKGIVVKFLKDSTQAHF